MLCQHTRHRSSDDDDEIVLVPSSPKVPASGPKAEDEDASSDDDEVLFETRFENMESRGSDVTDSRALGWFPPNAELKKMYCSRPSL